MIINDKVLVISHNPFSKIQNNGKTLESFLLGWPKDNIAQIYFTDNHIDREYCNNYLKINEKYIIKKLFNKKVDILNESSSLANNESHKSFFKKYKNLPVFWWIRNIIWHFGKLWKDENIIKWIDSFNPDIILFQTSDLSSVFDFVLKLKNHTNARLYMETTDDYLNRKYILSFLDYLRTIMMKKKYNKLLLKSSCVFVIGEEMKYEYEKIFDKRKFLVAMNCSDMQNKISSYRYNKNSNTIMFFYSGNLGLNRWKVLANLGKTLDSINNTNLIQSKLVICSLSQIDKKIYNCFNNINSIEYIGKINKNEIVQYINKSDILVHVESFDKRSIAITRLSVSTKISEYIVSDRCILAIGPPNVASIRYIKKYKSGMIIDNNDTRTWRVKVVDIINNNKTRELYIKNARDIAKKNHNLTNNIKMIQKELLKKGDKND